MKSYIRTAGALLLALGIIACQRGAPTTATNATAFTGVVTLDGSSTVFPISEAVAEEFQKMHPAVRVTVGISGTGGGFKKFVAGDIDIATASRPIAESEDTQLRQQQQDYIELPIAYDGVSVIVHPSNTMVNSLTIDELKRIWQPGSLVKLWSDLRPELPSQSLQLYGPGADSGTFDYFTEAVVGKAKSIRTDFTASEDDNVIAQGISGDPHALGYFGFAYYEANKSRMQLVAIDGGHGAVVPSEATIRNGTYPLARPLYLYIRRAALDRPEVAAFVQFYVAQAATLVSQVGYVPLSDAAYQLVTTRLLKKTVGSVARTMPHGTSVEQQLGAPR